MIMRVSQRSGSERGIAIMAVIMVLLALVSIATPFSLSMRNQDRSARVSAYQGKADVLAVTGLSMAEESLAATDADRDPTPYWDSPAELSVDLAQVAKRFGTDVNDPTGNIVSVRSEDEQGKVNINQCSPFLLQGVFGSVWLAQGLDADEENEISIGGGEQFADQGLIWVDGELILYRAREGSRLTGLTRAFSTAMVKSRPATAHEAGSPLVDYRILLASLRPYKITGGRFVGYSTVRELKDIASFGEVSFTSEELDQTGEFLTCHSVLPASTRFLGEARVMYPAGPNDAEPELFVLGGRNLGPGTVVRIRSGDQKEFNLVVGVDSIGEDQFRLRLQEPLQFDYDAEEAVVDGLARAPVNINSASRDVLIGLFCGLHLTSVVNRVDLSAATAIADRIISSRPVKGEKGLGEILQSLKDAGVIDEDDVLTILTNAQNASDANLRVGTAPFAYRTYGTFSLHAASSANLPAGREGAHRFARQISEVRPPGRQLTLFATQEDFEEQIRLSRTGRFWNTHPNNLQERDQGNEPSLRVNASLRGTVGSIEHDEEAPASAGLAPVRDEGRRDATAVMPEGMTERMIHFDGAEPEGEEGYDTRDHRGWNVKEKGPLSLEVDTDLTGLLSEREWVRPFGISFWWQPGESAAEGQSFLFDSGDQTSDEFSEITNRIFAYADGTELVFRVADNTVPDPYGESFPGGRENLNVSDMPTQMATIRYAFDDGLPFEEDVPYRLTFYARGTKPTDLSLFVDNVPRGRRAFQSQLSRDVSAPVDAGPFANIPGYSAGQNLKIEVEDASLFPPYGVIRIGDELIEYIDRNDDTFTVSNVTGDAFGGRSKRGSMGRTHKVGEAVELYGYVGILLSQYVGTGNLGLNNSLGRFGIAMVDPDSDAVQKSITTVFTGPDGNLELEIARGMDVTVNEIPLTDLANPNQSASTSASGGVSVEELFNKDGGYALVISCPRPPPSDGGNDNLQVGELQAEFSYERVMRTPTSALIGLGEFIYYAGFNDNTLTGVSRAPQSVENSQWSPDHSNLAEAGGGSGGDDMATGTFAHVHPFEWTIGVEQGHDARQPIFVIPLSVRPGGSSAQLADQYATPTVNGDQTFAEMVQIGRGFLGNVSGGGTEWIRYDVIGNGCFVRDDPIRLKRAVDICTVNLTTLYTLEGGQPPAVEAIAEALNYEQIAGTQEDRELIAKMASIPSSRLDGGVLAFRGVLGTEEKEHPEGALVLPVIRTFKNTEWAARPGTRDYVTLVDPLTESREDHRINYAYCESDVEDWGSFGCHFAFDAATTGSYQANFAELFSSVDPSSPSAAMNALTNLNIQSRDATRLMKFPSGELPTLLGEEIVFGGDLRAEPSPAGGIIDEIEFFNPTTPSDSLPLHVRFVLNRDDDFDGTLYLRRYGLRYNLWERSGDVIEVIDPISNLPEDGYVIQINEELIAISDVIFEEDSREVELEVAANGRGYLGTPIQAHVSGAPIREMTFLRVSRLETRLGVSDHEIELADASDFPMRGYVQVNKEIIGYVRKEGNVLIMPTWRDPSNRTNTGLFRGRFGTSPDRHEAGVLVQHFPVRYEDRYRPRADDPELSYLGLHIKGKSAFFNELTWQEEGATDFVSLRIGGRVGGRGNWTDDPDEVPDIFLFDDPGSQQLANKLLRQGKSLELRVYTDYQQGAFDASVFDPDPGDQRGGSNDWKRAPRLRALGVDWIAGPSRYSYEEWR